jgi:chemotaxis protein MotB
MNAKIAFLALLAVVGVSGCGVKKETHQKVLDELTATQGELSKTRKERDDLATKAKALETNLGASESAARQAAEMIRKLGGDVQKFEAELNQLRKQQEQAEQRLAAYRKLQDRLRALVDTGKLTIAFRSGQMVLKLPSEILFASGQANLSKTGQTALAEVLAVLQEFKDRRFMIAGHTDNVPIKTSRFRNNWQLSTARAVSVVEFMVQAGWAGKNVSAAGFGEFDPVAGNDSAEGKQLNRRIEIILVPDLSELPNLTSDPS